MSGIVQSVITLPEPSLEDLDRWLDQNLASTESWLRHPNSMSYTHEQEVKEQDQNDLTIEQVMEAIYPGLGEPVTDPDAPFFNEEN